MKNLYKLIIAFLVIPFFLNSNIAQNGKNPVALVQKTINDVKYKAEDKDWDTAKPGVTLKDGEEVKTGLKSLALVKFLDGSLVRVRENTTLNIYAKKENKQQVTNTVLSNGQINFDVKKQANGEFTFTTPTGIASIRGTSGLIDVPNNNESRFILETGLIELQATQGQKMNARLTPGNTAIITDDGNIVINESSNDDKNKLQSSKKTTIKKLIIQTENGTLEIEYYEKEQ